MNRRRRFKAKRRRRAARLARRAACVFCGKSRGSYVSTWDAGACYSCDIPF
jgi:transcription elongation factor Elf1